MLKMTKAEIELITDPNIHLIIRKGIRGSTCKPIYYHAKASIIMLTKNLRKKG